MGLDVTGRWRYPAPNADWLATQIEDVLCPELPIIDAHHHLWEEGGAAYLLDEICQDVGAGHAIRATVFVQAHYGYRTLGPAHLAPVGETEKVTTIARKALQSGCTTRIAEGIVAFADLTSGDALDEALDAHEFAGDGAFKGVRHSVSRDENFPDGIVLRPAPAEMLANPDYRSGLAKLVQRNLVYDAMIYHAQIPELISAARALPDLPIILDHVGCILGVGHYEGREAETFQHWRENMRELATCPNVRVKIGGFGMIVCGARWHERAMPPSSLELAEAWQPYVETCVDLFGANRCMFESNFPVDKAMYSYRTLWNTFKLLTARYSDDERAALFAKTAAETYSLDPVLAQSTSKLAGAATVV